MNIVLKITFQRLVCMLLMTQLLAVGYSKQRHESSTIDKEAEASSEALVDSKGIDVFSYPDVVMPDRIFTDEVYGIALSYQSSGERHPFFVATQFGKLPRSKRWVELPLGVWTEMISDYAPVTVEEIGGKCPFCKKTFRGLEVDLDTPTVGVTRCCGEKVYSRVEDMPADYPIRPNHSEVVTHPDGRSRAYEYFVPEGAMQNRKRWFSAEGELWRARLFELQIEVIPDLSARLLLDVKGEDVDAARTLAAIFIRLADVYPGLPFYDAREGYRFSDGIRDPQVWYDEQLKEWWAPMEPYEGKVRGGEAYSAKLTDLFNSFAEPGRFRHIGTLAEAYDLLRHHPEFERISVARFGNAEELDQRIMERLFWHLGGWARQYDPFTGNKITVWFPAALKLAVLLEDEEFLRKVAFYYESYLRNHFWADGLSMEAAFNYSEMLGYLFREPWISEDLMGVDFSQRYPLLGRIRDIGDYPVVTLAGLESIHADEHSSFFTSVGLDAVEGELDYSSPSQNFPAYGLTCLRAGVPGARMELLMDYQNAILHTHPAGLNLQLFYQGVNILPDDGYHNHNGKQNDPRFASLEYPLELLEPPAYSKDEVEMHNTGTALGSQFGHNSLCFERFWGKADSPFQMVQVEGKWIYDTGKWPSGLDVPEVSVFNRQVAVLTLPNGRALGLDFFRMRGGLRHDVYWHAPAEATECSLGAGSIVEAPSLFEHFQAVATPEPGWMKEATYFYDYMVNIKKAPYFEGLRLFENPREWKLDDVPWKIRWLIDPSRYEPVSAAGLEKYEPWRRWLRPVNLDLWGYSFGAGAVGNQLFGATAPWSGTLEMGTLGRNSRMAFKDGVQVAMVHRQGEVAGEIASTFVHLIDPSVGGQHSVLRSVNVAEALNGVSDMGAFACALTSEGDRLVVASSLSGGMISDQMRTLSTDARLAVIMPELAMLALFDGHVIESSLGVGIEVAEMPEIRVIGLAGDLTGQPQESALIVESDEALPVGNVLSGLTLTVEHQTSEAHASGYEIEDIVALAENRYRINLRHNPPFIERLVRVTSVNNGGASVDISHHLHDGLDRPYGLDRFLWLPRSGYRSTLKSQEVRGYSGWHSETLTPTDPMSEQDVRVGDALVIYKIQSGDRVIIPGAVTCRPVSIDNGEATCEVFSTGAGSLLIDGAKYPFAAGEQSIQIQINAVNALKLKRALAASAALTAEALNVSVQP
jgi:hypothetical protein